MDIRDKWLACHRWLALAVGGFWVLLGLTGSLSVYRVAVDELLNPRLVVAQAGRSPAALDRVIAAVRQAHPRRHGAWTLEMPMSAHGTITAWYDNPHETAGEFYAPLMVAVDPYQAEVIASRFWGETLTTWLLDWHTQLHFGRRGWHAVAFLGVLLAVSVVSGLYLWWPGWRRVPSALAIRHRAGMVQFGFDLHRTAGLVLAPLLLLAAFTGFHLAYPEVLEAWAGAPGMGHGNNDNGVRSLATPNDNPVSLESAVFIASSVFPRAELRRIVTPDGDKGVYRVDFHRRNDVGRKHPYASVWLDRWSGQILEVRNPAAFTPAQTLATWMWPLHTGEAFSPVGRLLWFGSGPALCLIYLGGLMRWLNRRGMLRDRPVDVAALVDYARRQGTLTCRNAWRGGTALARASLSFSRHAYRYACEHYRRFRKSG